MTKRSITLSPAFLISLLALLLNDFYLKQAFPGFLTGKLSDVCGLVVFSVFVAHIAPASKKWVSIVTGVLFLIWKTPVVSPIIDLLNQFLYFKVQRVVDYSDYWALLILPFAHKVINRDSGLVIDSNELVRLSQFGVASVSFFAICATSTMRLATPDGMVYIGENYTVKKSKLETIDLIKSLGYNVDYYKIAGGGRVSGFGPLTKVSYYQTDNVIVYDDSLKPVDTIVNVKYRLHELNSAKTQIEIINVTLGDDTNIQEWQTLKYLRKRYKKVLEKQMIEKVKQH